MLCFKVMAGWPEGHPLPKSLRHRRAEEALWVDEARDTSRSHTEEVVLAHLINHNLGLRTLTDRNRVKAVGHKHLAIKSFSNTLSFDGVLCRHQHLAVRQEARQRVRHTTGGADTLSTVTIVINNNVRTVTQKREDVLLCRDEHRTGRRRQVRLDVRVTNEVVIT